MATESGDATTDPLETERELAVERRLAAAPFTRKLLRELVQDGLLTKQEARILESNALETGKLR
jgi:hypothetical protein